MKKIITLSILCLIPLLIFSQKKIAVYVTATENVEIGTKKIIGSKLVSAIVSNKEYSAVERTSEFLTELSKEQGYQRSGNVDDNQISELGRQFGVNVVCVADITLYQSSYYIQARLIDVESATVSATAEETSTFELNSIVSASEKLATKLVGAKPTSKTYSYEFSSYVSCDAPSCYLIKIERTANYTIAYCKYVSSGTWACANQSFFIQDKDTHTKYYLASAQNIAICPNRTEVAAGVVLDFKLYFDPIPESTKAIEIIEDEANRGFNFHNVRLIPYGDPNIHFFQDALNNAINEENNLKNNIKQQKEQNAVNDLGRSLVSLSESINKLNSYILIITNTHTSPRNIYIASKYIGSVPANSTTTFTVPINLQGKVQSIQASGYVFSPNQESSTISNVKKQQTIKIKF